MKRPRIELHSTCQNFVQDPCVLGISCRESPLSDAMHCDEVHCAILPNIRPMRADEITNARIETHSTFQHFVWYQCDTMAVYAGDWISKSEKCNTSDWMHKFCTWIRPMRIRKIGSHKWATRCIASQKYIILCARWGIKQLARTKNYNAMHTCPPFVRDQWQLSSQKLTNV